MAHNVCEYRHCDTTGIILFRHMGNAVTDTSGVPRLTVVWSVG
jgi:hypothetical protein